MILRRPWRLSRPARLRESRRFLEETVARIVEKTRPLRIILFGSYAYGRPTRHSDLDLLVIADPRRRPVQRESYMYGLKPAGWGFSVDFLVLTPRAIGRSLEGFDPFLEEVLRKGKVLYDKAKKK